MKGGEVFVGAVMALGGVQVLLRGFAMRREVHKVASWQTTEGRVTRSELIRHDTGTWGAAVEYAYTVGGMPYSGGVVNLAGSVNVGFTDRYARRVVERYPEGGTVLVHFEADEPEHAVLEASPSSASTVRFAIGLVFLGVGALALVIGLA